MSKNLSRILPGKNRKKSEKKFIDKVLRLVINEVIKKEARKEAYEIMTKCDDKYVKEFFTYYNKKSLNIVPLVIDSAKEKLVRDGKMKHRKKDHFGLPEYYVALACTKKISKTELKRMLNNLISRYKK